MLEAVNLKPGDAVTLPSGRTACVTAIARHTVEFLYVDGGGLVEITRMALKGMAL